MRFSLRTTLGVTGALVAVGFLAASATMVYKAREPVVPEEEQVEPPPVEREVVTLTVDGREHPITSRVVVIGRSRECDVRLADTNVSRRHAELRLIATGDTDQLRVIPRSSHQRRTAHRVRVNPTITPITLITTSSSSKV